MKKILALLLCLSMLISIFPSPISYGATYTITASEYPKFSALSVTEKNALQKIKNENVILKTTNTKDPMYVCAKVLVKYNIVVYNYNNQCTTSIGFEDGDSNGEFRYLGYDLMGKKVSNDFRLNDGDTGQINPNTLKNRNWIKIDKKLDTWKSTIPETQQYMVNHAFVSDDGTNTENPDGVTLRKVLSNKETGSDATLLPYIQMQSQATLASRGSAKMIHSRPGGNYYNTFIFPRIEKTYTPILTTSIFSDSACTKKITQIEFLPEQTELTIYVKVNTDASMNKLAQGGQEAKYIASVTNSLDKVTASERILTNLSNSSNMASVYPCKLLRQNYTTVFKPLNFIGKASVKATYDVINILKPPNSTATIEIKALPPIPNGLKAEFRIFHLTKDETDQSVQTNETSISKDYVFDLKDITTVPKDNSIKGHNWFLFNNTTQKNDFVGGGKDFSFTLKPSAVADYVKEIDNKKEILFEEVVVDKFDKTYTVTHTVALTLKDSPIPPPKPEDKPILPKAYVYPPKMLRAGQKTIISGEGTSANSTISNYEFEYDLNFKEIQSISDTEKEGSFLAYDTTDTTGLTVTDALGKTASATDQTIVNHPIDAYMKTNGIYKINRTIELDSTESTGTTFYPIDKVTWVITPMDGQNVENIKLHDVGSTVIGGKTVVGAKPKVDFKQLGRYAVWMDVHSTCTFLGQEWRTASKQVYGIITIAPDEPPVAKLSVPTKTIRDFNTLQKSYFDVWDESYSPDGDNIGKRKYFVRFDSDNDKSTADEVWSMIYEGIEDHIVFDSPNVGNYEFRVEVEEANESVFSPFWNPFTDTLRSNSDKQPLAEKMTEIINVAPITAISVERKKLDLSLVTDYEGTDLSALRTEIDLLTKDLFEVGVDVNVQIFTDKISKGRVKAPVYSYTRYLRVNYTSDYNINNNTGTKVFSELSPWETRYQLETAYLPGYNASPVGITMGYYNSDNPSYGIIDNGLELDLSAPSDPSKKNGKKRITETRVVPTSGTVEYFRNIRDINATIDGTFTKGEINSYSDLELYCMDLEKVKATASFREGSDRQMLFIMKTGDSLTTLSQGFADFIKQKSVTVTAISGFDMLSQYGGLAVKNAEFVYRNSTAGSRPPESYKEGAWIQNILEDSAPQSIALKMEDGKTFALGSYQTGSYPTVLSNYTFRNNPNEVRSFVNWREYYGEQNSYELPTRAETMAFSLDSNSLTKAHDTYDKYNDASSVTVGSGEEDRRGRPIINTYPMDINWVKKLIYNVGADEPRWGLAKRYYFTRFGNLYRVDVPQNGLSDYSLSNATLEANNVEITKDGGWGGISILYYRDTNRTRLIWQSSTAVKGGNGDWYYTYGVNDQWLDGDTARVDVRSTGAFTSTSDSARRSRFAPGVIDIKTTNGDSYRIMGVGTESPSYRTSNTLVLKLPDGFTALSIPNTGRRAYEDSGYKDNSYHYLYGDTETSRTSYFMSQTGDIYKTQGGYDGNGNIYTQPVTQGLNIEKVNIYTTQNEGWAQIYCMAQTHEGKLYGFSLTGGTVVTTANATNLVKDPRTLSTPIVDATSMRKLLNQSAANKISGTFAEFSTALKSSYDGLKYQSREIKLLDETIDVKSVYSDYEGDPLYESAIAITHNQNALENPIGTDAFDGKNVPNWNGKLTKTGLYTLIPRVRDNPNDDDRFADYRLWNKDNMTTEILVHRKPIASMRISTTNAAPYSLTAKDSNSYDLDHISQPTGGIVEVEWGLKKVFDDAWQITSGTLGTTMSGAMETGETYIVSYRVKDVEGQWSDPVTEQVVAGMNLLMDAKLETESPTQSLTKFQTGNNVKFTNLWSSYALAHRLEIQMFNEGVPILNKVTLRKEWGNVKTEAYPERDWHDVLFAIPKGLADKTYQFIVTAYDDINASIKKYNTFQLTSVSNSAPIITFAKFEPTDLYEADMAKVQVKVSDPDGDRLKVQIYISFDGKPEKMLEVQENVISGTGLDLAPFEIPNAKSIKLRGVVIDPYLAEGQAEMVKPIQAFGIETVKITGAWQHWRGQKNAFGQLMTNEPNRFLSYEKIHIVVESRGNPDQVKIRLEAPLEAMRYTDPKGNVYDYKEELGYEVSFPINFTISDVNKFNLDYILPFANSSIDWMDQRKRPPYKLYVTLIKDGRTRIITIGDDAGEANIDLTGNIFDLIYNQPAKKKR